MQANLPWIISVLPFAFYCTQDILETVDSTLEHWMVHNLIWVIENLQGASDMNTYIQTDVYLTKEII